MGREGLNLPTDELQELEWVPLKGHTQSTRQSMLRTLWQHPGGGDSGVTGNHSGMSRVRRGHQQPGRGLRPAPWGWPLAKARTYPGFATKLLNVGGTPRAAWPGTCVQQGLRQCFQLLGGRTALCEVPVAVEGDREWHRQPWVSAGPAPRTSSQGCGGHT